MKNKFYLKSLSILVVLLVSYIALSNIQHVQGAIPGVNTGDEFLYKITEDSIGNQTYRLETDDNPIGNNYITISYWQQITTQDFSFKVLNTSQTNIQVNSVYGERWNEYYFNSELDYLWNNGWYVSANYSNVDDTSHVIDEYTYGFYDTYVNYSNLAYDFFYGTFEDTSYNGTDVFTGTINDNSVSITVDVYYYLDKPNGIGYENTYSGYQYGVSFQIVEYYWYEYYYYVDPTTGIPLRVISVNYYTRSGSFYAYSPDFGCNISWYEYYDTVTKREYNLALSTSYYAPYASDAFLPYVEINFPNGYAITNQSTFIPIEFNLVETDYFTVDIYYKAPDDYYYQLYDSFVIDNTLYFVYYFNTTDLPYYKGYSHGIKIVVSDSLGKYVYETWFDDQRVIVPDWTSWVFVRSDFNAPSTGDAYVFDYKVFSDTSWNITTKLYYGPGAYDYYYNYYSGAGNATLDLWLYYLYNVTAYQDYTANIVFVDAVGTTYEQNVTIHIYPEGTDCMPPYIDKIGNYKYKYELGTSDVLSVYLSDINTYNYSLLVDGAVVQSGSNSGEYWLDIYFENIFTSPGVYNMTVEAFDAMGNIRSESCWVDVYPAGYDVDEPWIYANIPYDYPIGHNDKVTVEFYDKNPDYYEIELDGSMISSGYYYDGFVFEFYLMDYAFTPGYHYLYIWANDTYANEYETVYEFNAYDPEPETFPPDIDAPDEMTVLVNTTAYLTFSLYEEYPDVFNVYMNGTAIWANYYYTGDGYPNSEFNLDLSAYCSTVGYYNFTIEAFDQWGNVAVKQVNVYVVDSLPDTTSPTITYNCGNPCYYQIGTDFWIDITLEDENPSYFEILIDGTQVLNGTYLSGDVFSLNLNDYIYDEGTHNLEIFAYDLAGNTGYVSITIEATTEPIDTMPPQVQFDCPVNVDYEIGTNYYIEIKFFDENPDYFEIYIDGSYITGGNFYDGYVFRINLNNYIFTEGNHKLEVFASDSVGNSNWYGVNIYAHEPNNTTDTGTDTNTDTTSTTDTTNQTITLPFNFLYVLTALVPLGVLVRKIKK